MRLPRACFLCAFFSQKTAIALHASLPNRVTFTDVLRQAAVVRDRIGSPPPLPQDAEVLSFPSSYPRPDMPGVRRGYCNWLIPGFLIVGQYPGRTPEAWGPTLEQAEEHIRSVVVDGRVTVFCSLQSEVPAQDDDRAWDRVGGYVNLEYPYKAQFPRSFTRYAPSALRAAESLSEDRTAAPPLKFLHEPIEDLTVPESSVLLSLLLTLLNLMEEDRGAIYLHCWGGRGRAGVVGACLVSLIWPELDSVAVLDLVQAGYTGRAGANSMPEALSRSPQTEEQRRFVSNFLRERTRKRSF